MNSDFPGALDIIVSALAVDPFAQNSKFTKSQASPSVGIGANPWPNVFN
jgi:hypothetical protein